VPPLGGDGRREVALAPAKRRVAGQGCQDKQGVRGVDGEHRSPGAGICLDPRVLQHGVSAQQRDHGSEQNADQPGAPASRSVIGLAVVNEPGPAGRGAEASEDAIKDCQREEYGGDLRPSCPDSRDRPQHVQLDAYEVHSVGDVRIVANSVSGRWSGFPKSISCLGS
jgi:hypothetical protein